MRMIDGQIVLVSKHVVCGWVWVWVWRGVQGSAAVIADLTINLKTSRHANSPMNIVNACTNG